MCKCLKNRSIDTIHYVTHIEAIIISQSDIVIVKNL